MVRRAPDDIQGLNKERLLWSSETHFGRIDKIVTCTYLICTEQEMKGDRAANRAGKLLWEDLLELWAIHGQGNFAVGS